MHEGGQHPRSEASGGEVNTVSMAPNPSPQDGRVGLLRWAQHNHRAPTSATTLVFQPGRSSAMTTRWGRCPSWIRSPSIRTEDFRTSFLRSWVDDQCGMGEKLNDVVVQGVVDHHHNAQPAEHNSSQERKMRAFSAISTRALGRPNCRLCPAASNTAELPALHDVRERSIMGFVLGA